ncbi:hypothetical protein [Actinosynnema sp. NPDC020468]|uniref:hypothetical protein n=1 Tax=Actinosynnema sp. NPDC020468 TaxID=3154488 RepID=UPI0034092FE4
MRFRAVALGLCAVALEILASTSVAAAVPSTATPFAATPIGCVAVYVKAGKPKVPGEPTELVLRNYSCGGVHASLGKLLLKAFEHLNYQGSSVDFEVNQGNTDCDIDGYQWKSMPAGWNDRISSFRTYGGCQGVRLYEHDNTSGSCGSYFYDVSYVGDAMNDKTSSFRNSSQSKPC